MLVARAAPGWHPAQRRGARPHGSSRGRLHVRSLLCPRRPLRTRAGIRSSLRTRTGTSTSTMRGRGRALRMAHLPGTTSRSRPESPRSPRRCTRSTWCVPDAVRCAVLSRQPLFAGVSHRMSLRVAVVRHIHRQGGEDVRRPHRVLRARAARCQDVCCVGRGLVRSFAERPSARLCSGSVLLLSA